jgi:two-component system, NarL family, response regulator NreC
MSPHLHLAPSVSKAAFVPAAVPVRVVLSDDRALTSDGLRGVLDEARDMDVVAVCDLASTSGQLRCREADVVALDAGVPGGSSLQAVGRLRERAPDTEIVVVTPEDDPVFAQRALTAGATGYVTRDGARRELTEAIRAAARGEQYVSPPMAARLETLYRSLTENALTPREVEVVRLIALGHTSVEIARKLHLSPRTVETHRAHIHKKLGLTTRAQLVGYALRRKLLGP